jgi:hypothetical protein
MPFPAFSREIASFINQKTHGYNQPRGCELKKSEAQPKKTTVHVNSQILRRNEPLD